VARFEVGNPGGPGRPPGSWSGRRRAVQIIDEILADAGNAEALRAALQRRFDRDPVRFWLRIGAPLLPRESKLELDSTQEIGQAVYLALLRMNDTEGQSRTRPELERTP